jgi:hypothetical protein
LIEKSVKNEKLLHSIISDILDFSRYNNQKLRIIPATFNLKSTILDVVYLFEYQAEK